MSYWTQPFFNFITMAQKRGMGRGGRAWVSGQVTKPSFLWTSCSCRRFRLTFQNQSGLLLLLLLLLHTWTRFCWLPVFFFFFFLCFYFLTLPGDQTSILYVGEIFFFPSLTSPASTRSPVRSADHTGPIGDDEMSFSNGHVRPRQGLCFYFYTCCVFFF